MESLHSGIPRTEGFAVPLKKALEGVTAVGAVSKLRQANAIWRVCLAPSWSICPPSADSCTVFLMCESLEL